jgi:hypothetical protein
MEDLFVFIAHLFYFSRFPKWNQTPEKFFTSLDFFNYDFNTMAVDDSHAHIINHTFYRDNFISGGDGAKLELSSLCN